MFGFADDVAGEYAKPNGLRHGRFKLQDTPQPSLCFVSGRRRPILDLNGAAAIHEGRNRRFTEVVTAKLIPDVFGIEGIRVGSSIFGHHRQHRPRSIFIREPHERDILSQSDRFACRMEVSGTLSAPIDSDEVALPNG